MERSEFSIRLGDNLRATRLRRGLSSDELADRLAEHGVILSGRGIRNYEAGDRELSVDLLIKLSVCLDCSTQTLLDGLDPRTAGQDDGAVEYNLLSPEEHNVFRYMATGWKGDRHALIVFTALYMTLPPKYRRDAPLSLLAQTELALRDGAITEADLPKDLKYMESKMRELYK